MPSSLVGTPAYGVGTPPGIAYTIIGTTNHVLIAGVTSTSGEDILGITDTKGNTWNALGSLLDSGTWTLHMFYAIPNGTGADTITPTLDLGNTTTCIVAEFDGIAPSSVSDGVATGSGSGTNPVTGNLVTTETDLIVAWALADGEGISPSGGYTALGISGTSREFEYQVGVAAGTRTVGFTASSGAWVIKAAGIKELSSPAAAIRITNNRGVRPRPFAPGLAR